MYLYILIFYYILYFNNILLKRYLVFCDVAIYIYIYIDSVRKLKAVNS